MRHIFMTILLASSILITACGNNDGLEPIEQTQTAVAGTQAALSIGSTQTALAAIQATQNAQVAATQTREANPNPVIARNADWTPVERDFELPQGGTVTMVLVPAGCFDMGSTDEQIDYAVNELGANRERMDDEQPVHEVCFDEPFWIDKYEVTNDQYGSVGCESWSSEPDQPRNCVSWFEASDYCEARSARLPTETEWEYAARGPDSLVYPWGNEWNPDNANWSDTSPDEIFTVGSFPQGASWVGALDMSGNLWEWTSSIYDQDNFPYPYDEADGREDNDDRSSVRVLRGGSFSAYQDSLRAAPRAVLNPHNDRNTVGFRCVRPPSL